MDNNIVQIGTALKWCNDYDSTKKYYLDNIITTYGCVFRCKVSQTQGKSPVTVTDEEGRIAYANTDIWDVIVDMAYYYNYYIDTMKAANEALEFAENINSVYAAIAAERIARENADTEMQQVISKEIYEATKKTLLTEQEREALTEIDENMMYMTYEDE